MIIRIASAKCVGIEALPVTVEVSVSNGIGIHLVGLADVAVRESLLRTVTALQTMGMKVPGKKIVINLAPADMHKKGSGYDLPIALGIIAASEQMEMPGLTDYVIVGELGLDGTVRDIAGGIPISELAHTTGAAGCILPFNSAIGAACFKNSPVYGIHNLRDALSIVCNRPEKEGLLVTQSTASFIHGGIGGQDTDVVLNGNACIDGGMMDFSEIIGQEAAKRGLEIAASGGHNVILIGPPGSGKSSLAKAMCGILPPMSPEEALQTSKIYSVAGRGDIGGPYLSRPFRAPHNTVSAAALLGGGTDNISPGEISLAHNGILFLDELCEIPRKTIDLLRAPMEDRRIVISRLKTKVEYPADFTLVAATNPCPCGYYGDGDRCTCSVGQRKNYLSRLSGPLMDRIDIQLWCAAVPPGQLIGGNGDGSRKAGTSAEIAARVKAVRELQKERFREDGIFCNAQMNNRQTRKYCPLDGDCRTFLENLAVRMGMSARSCMKIIRLARTIADMDGSETISIRHLSEAASYRFLDKASVL